MRIKPAAIIIPVLICLLGLVTGSILIWRLFYVSLFLTAASLIWLLVNIFDIVIYPGKLPAKIHAGEWLEQGIIINNKINMPKFLVTVSEISNIPGQPRQLSMNLAPSDWYRWNSRIYFKRRGRYNLGIFRISTSDPFGLLTIRRKSGEQQGIIVYPQIIDLPLFQPEFHFNPEQGAGRWTRNETGTSVSRVREYSRGDTLNHIHWHSTAHTGNLMVKVFDPEQRRSFRGDTWLVMNMHQGVYPRVNDKNMEDTAVTIAASLIYKYTENGKQIGFLTDGDTHSYFPPDTGDDYQNKLMETLALIQADGTMTLDSLISQQIGQFKPESIMIIITTSIDEKLATAVRDLKNRRHTPIVIMLDSVSFNGKGERIITARYPAYENTPVYLIKNEHDVAKQLDSRGSPSLVNHSQGYN